MGILARAIDLVWDDLVWFVDGDRGIHMKVGASRLCLCANTKRGEERARELHSSVGRLSIPRGRAGQQKLIWHWPQQQRTKVHFVNKVGIWFWHGGFQNYLKVI